MDHLKIFLEFVTVLLPFYVFCLFWPWSMSEIAPGESESCSVVSDSLWPHGLYSAWNSPGQNARVGSLSLLQGIFQTQELNPGLPHCRRILYQLSHKGSSRILEWVAYPFSSVSSQPRNPTRVSCIAGRFFTNWAIMEGISSQTRDQICVLFIGKVLTPGPPRKSLSMWFKMTKLMTESYSLRWLKTMRDSTVSLQSLLICHAQHTTKRKLSWIGLFNAHLIQLTWKHGDVGTVLGMKVSVGLVGKKCTKKLETPLWTTKVKSSEKNGCVTWSERTLYSCYRLLEEVGR